MHLHFPVLNLTTLCLFTQSVSLQDQIQQEKEKQDELDAQMREMRRKIDDQRKNTGTKSQKEKASETKRKSTRMESILQLVSHIFIRQTKNYGWSFPFFFQQVAGAFLYQGKQEIQQWSGEKQGAQGRTRKLATGTETSG